VVFSHGNNGIRFQSFFLCEQLASHGFVVAAPDHVGNTAVDLLIPGPPFTITDRPLDVSFVITRMLERSLDPVDPLYGRVDPGGVGVAGHSFGGFTALAVAAGFGGVPADPRVRAIAPIAPVSTILSAEELGGIFVPTLIVGGTSDTTTPVDPQSEWAQQHVAGRPLYRVDVLDAGHNSFTDVCDIGAALIGAGLPPALLDFLLGNLDEGCSPELVDVQEAHRLTNHYVVAFMRSHLARDGFYLRFLKLKNEEAGVDLVVFVACGSGVGGLAFAGMFLALGALRRARL
jgi:predicted dienelactone hydrolase